MPTKGEYHNEGRIVSHKEIRMENDMDVLVGPALSPELETKEGFKVLKESSDSEL